MSVCMSVCLYVCLFVCLSPPSGKGTVRAEEFWSKSVLLALQDLLFLCFGGLVCDNFIPLLFKSEGVGHYKGNAASRRDLHV